jgi:hypothetical protein
VFVHPIAVRAEALALIDAGHNDCEVARSLGVPRTTVRDWRRRPYQSQPAAICPRCWRPSRRPIVFTDAHYAELLGLYLGDGHIVRTGRSDRLRLFLDTRYSGINADARDLLRRCFPKHQVGMFRSGKGTTTILSVYGTHLACLFPQHGAGRKHNRGVFANRTGRYTYLSYEFSNRSAQIRELFMSACDLVNVEYRPYHRYVRIYRRASVPLMLEHVGLKE